MKKNCKRQIKQSLELRTKSREIGVKLLTVDLIKSILYKMSYILEPYTHTKSEIRVALDLSNYAAKSDL